MFTVIDIEPTPNPNALKFILNARILEDGSIQYNSAKDAGNDTLGLALFQLPGVESVFYMADFITISKNADTPWEEILDKAETLISTTPPMFVAPEKSAEQVKRASASTVAQGAFNKLTDDERLEQIEQFLDAEIRPALAMDGGGIDVRGVEGMQVKIHYEGACGSCPTSTAGTLTYIEARLKELLGGELEIVPV